MHTIFKIILLLPLLFIGGILNGQTYKVISRTALNVREGAGINTKIIGKVAPKETVRVVQLGEEWAKINYREGQGYVSNKYILPVSAGKKKTGKEFFRDLWGLFSQGPVNYLPLLIFLIFASVLLLWQLFSDSETLRLCIGIIGLTGTCILELFYFLHYNIGFPWFCDPAIVGWLWTIVNFFLYGFVLLWQVKFGLKLIRSICRNRRYDLRTGIYSYPIAFALLLIFSLADINMTEYIIAGWGLAQIGQVIVNFYLIRHWGKALLVSVLFLSVSFALIISSAYFAAMLIMIAIILLLLSFLGNPQTVYIKEY